MSSCVACTGPVFYEMPDGSSGNAYECSPGNEAHADICIACAYTYYRTRLLDHLPLTCFDHQCKRPSYDIDGIFAIAKASLTADELLTFMQQQSARLRKQGAEARAAAEAQAAQDTPAMLAYAVRHTRRCPDCLVRAEKVNGCDHVRCQNCGRQFQFSEARIDIDSRELLTRRVLTRSMTRKIMFS